MDYQRKLNTFMRAYSNQHSGFDYDNKEMTLEYLYQAFKERMIKELMVADEKLIDGYKNDS